MKVIRTFWGDVHSMGTRYTEQIDEAISDNINEIVYVWGIDNYNFIKSKGFDCKLISEDSYNRNLASNHTFWDHKSLNHKLWVIENAVMEYGEILFLDWDCRLIKKMDDEFYSFLKNGNALQVPLYVYPKKALDWLIHKTKSDTVNPFFHKLKKFMIQYSYSWGENYIIPNTGFIYCRDTNIKLLKISLDLKLEAVPDEFSVMAYAMDAGISLDDYINLIEPKVIRGKEHTESWWVEAQNEFNHYIDSKINKSIYFIHK